MIMEVLNMTFNAEQIQENGCPNLGEPPRPNLTAKQKTKRESNRRF